MYLSSLVKAACGAIRYPQSKKCPVFLGGSGRTRLYCGWKRLTGWAMTFFLAVANRKGGVGKSTVSVMLAHAFSVWGGKRVLILDLDSQCNSSMILLGGEGWVQARSDKKTVADFFSETFEDKGRVREGLCRRRCRRRSRPKRSATTTLLIAGFPVARRCSGRPISLLRVEA